MEAQAPEGSGATCRPSLGVWDTSGAARFHALSRRCAHPPRLPCMTAGRVVWTQGLLGALPGVYSCRGGIHHRLQAAGAQFLLHSAVPSVESPSLCGRHQASHAGLPGRPPTTWQGCTLPASRAQQVPPWRRRRACVLGPDQQGQLGQPACLGETLPAPAWLARPRAQQRAASRAAGGTSLHRGCTAGRHQGAEPARAAFTAPPTLRVLLTRLPALLGHSQPGSGASLERHLACPIDAGRRLPRCVIV